MVCVIGEWVIVKARLMLKGLNLLQNRHRGLEGDLNFSISQLLFINHSLLFISMIKETHTESTLDRNYQFSRLASRRDKKALSSMAML